jgi:maltooligosyltrehalose trehalohydrolase
VSALLLLLPQVPLLFMGQEWAASTPFLYFTDHAPGLGPAITAGRRQEFSAFAAFSDPQARAQIPDPQDPSTFARSRLHWAERGDPPHAGVERLYRALLRLRRDEPAFRGQNQTAAVSAPDDDTVVVRRGPFVAVARLRREGVVALPLTAHHVLLSSEDDEFASSGAAPHFDHATGRLHFSGPATVLLRR